MADPIDFDSLPDAPAKPAQEFDTPPTAAETAAAQGFDLQPADTAAGSLQGAPPELLQRRDAGIALDLPPRRRPEPAPSVPPDFLAWQMVNSDVTPEQASEAISLSKRIGLSPEFVARNLDDIRKRVDLEDLRATMRSSPDWSMERPQYKEGRVGIPGSPLLPQPVADLLYATGLSGGAFSSGGHGGGPKDPSPFYGSPSPYRLAEQTIARAANAFVMQTGREPGAPEWEHWVKEMVRPGYELGGGKLFGDGPEVPWAVAKSHHPDMTFIPKPDPGFVNIKDSAGRIATNVAAPPPGHLTMLDKAGEAWTVLAADGSVTRALKMGWRTTEVLPYRPGAWKSAGSDPVGAVLNVVNAIGGPIEHATEDVVGSAAYVAQQAVLAIGLDKLSGGN
jgi:hypothetical protein